jgi:hypothetical protein
MFSDGPGCPGNNHKPAIHQFLKTTDRFEIDQGIPEQTSHHRLPGSIRALDRTRLWSSGLSWFWGIDA